jgi:hypothetical protein
MKPKKWVLVSITVFGVALFAAMTTAEESPKMKELPSLVMNAVKNLFPSAAMEKTQPENISIAAYEVDVKEGAEIKSAVIASDGAVISVESKVAAESLPDAVSKTISEKAKGANILGVEKEEIYMEPQLVKLAQPKTTYEARVSMDGKTYEIVVDAAGSLLEMKAEDGDKKKTEEGDDKEEGDNEQVIALDKLPDVVRTAIVNASEGGTIKEVVSGQENGKTAYEADVVINGQEFEIKVDADGRVLEKKAEKDDDDEKKDKD